MKCFYICIGLIWALGSCLWLPAQNAEVSIVDLSLSGNWISGSLGQVSVINHQEEALPVYLLAQVRPSQGQPFQDRTEVFSLQPGYQSLDLSGLSLSDPRYVQEGKEQIQGSVEICLEIYDETHQRLASSCESIIREASMPPYLVYPFDGELLETPVPVFTWTPPAPLQGCPGVQYLITITELSGNGNPIAVIRNQPAYYQQEGLLQTVMPYPVAARPFDPEKHYAWQIEAICQGQSLGKSEVWTFGFAQDLEEEKKPRKESFVELDAHPQAGYYLAQGELRIRFDKRYGEEGLAPHIYSEDRQEIPLEDKQIEQVGDNRFVLHLPPGSGLEEGAFYTLEVEDGKGRISQLRFKYLAE